MKEWTKTNIQARDSWQVLRMQSDLVKGFETLFELGPTVAVYGSARTNSEDSWYKEAYKFGRLMADEGFNVITGGGPGIIGMAIVDAHPNMKGVIFDLPLVVKITKTFIKEFKMQDRVEILGGDYNNDPIGEDYDLIVTCNSLQFASDINLVMKKIFDSLNQKGVLVSLFGFGRTNENTKPENLVLGLLSKALMGKNMEFHEGYLADSMAQTGFKSVQSKILKTSWGNMELDIARK